MQIHKTESPKNPPLNVSQVAFGSVFTDHMLCVDWCQQDGWSSPVIKPLTNLQLHPASCILHYANGVSFWNRWLKHSIIIKAVSFYINEIMFGSIKKNLFSFSKEWKLLEVIKTKFACFGQWWTCKGYMKVQNTPVCQLVIEIFYFYKYIKWS